MFGQCVIHAADRRAGQIDTVALLKKARDFPKECLVTEDVDVSFYKAVVWHIAFYVSKIYGKRAMQTWVNKNKGSSILQMITTSDMVYSFALVENNEDNWDQLFSISNLPKEEQMKYKASNREQLPEDERASYKKLGTKFTARKGKKQSYLSHGWSTEGIKYYEARKAEWKKVYANKTQFDKLEQVFDDTLREGGFGTSGFGCYWKEKPGDDEEEEVEDEIQELCLPGDDIYESERPWSVVRVGDKEGATGKRLLKNHEYTHEEMSAKCDGVLDDGRKLTASAIRKRRKVARVSYGGDVSSGSGDSGSSSDDDSEEE